MNKRISVFKAIITAVLALSITLSPAQGIHADAASKKEEKAVMKVADRLFEGILTYDTKKMKGCVKRQSNKTYNYKVWTSDKNPDPFEKMRKIQKKLNKETFSYQIDKVTVKGSKATIKATVDYVDLSEEYEKAYSEALHWNYYNRKASNKKFWSMVALYYKENYDDLDGEYDVETDRKITLKATKVNGKWYITGTDKTFKKCVDCGSTQMQVYIDNHIQKYYRENYRP